MQAAWLGFCNHDPPPCVSHAVLLLYAQVALGFNVLSIDAGEPLCSGMCFLGDVCLGLFMSSEMFIGLEA